MISIMPLGIVIIFPTSFPISLRRFYCAVVTNINLLKTIKFMISLKFITFVKFKDIFIKRLHAFYTYISH